MDNEFYKGSICLSDIPKEEIKEYNGKKYLNVAIFKMREPKTFQSKNGPRTFTHCVSCKPKPENVREGVNYYLGNLETMGNSTQQQSRYIDPDAISDAPTAKSYSDDDGLPF